MKPVAHKFYDKLARRGRYLSRVRNLVPKYDEMTELIVNLIRRSSPSCLLDIGPGIGHLDHLILTELPKTRITAVEASKEMFQVCQKNLDLHYGRIQLLHQDIVESAPTEKYDAIFSNLVLHNIPYDEKKTLLKRLRHWLTPGGIFIWGDMIRFLDSEIQEYFVQIRLGIALAHEVTKELAHQNFEKELHHDYPLTIKETFQLGQDAGFSAVENIWVHDTFSIFLMRLTAK